LVFAVSIAAEFEAGQRFLKHDRIHKIDSNVARATFVQSDHGARSNYVFHVLILAD
jgi:hypothetical protein